MDGQDGGNDYYRGACWYVRALTDEELAGEAVFPKLGGVAMTADVWFNGKRLARHEGGYSAFRVELTEELAGENALAIAVSNEDNDRVYPQKADFTFYGGLYREVKLIRVPREHFELAADGTPGIKVTPIVDLGKKTVAVAVETWQNAERVSVTVNGETKTVPSVNGHARAVDDDLMEDGTVHDSLNHYAYGAVSGWLFDGVCGIRLRDGKLAIAPKPHPCLGYARAEWRSPIGVVQSGWKYEGNRLIFDISVPVSSLIRLPNGRQITAEKGEHRYEVLL